MPISSCMLLALPYLSVPGSLCRVSVSVRAWIHVVVYYRSIHFEQRNKARKNVRFNKRHWNTSEPPIYSNKSERFILIRFHIYFILFFLPFYVGMKKEKKERRTLWMLIHQHPNYYGILLTFLILALSDAHSRPCTSCPPLPCSSLFFLYPLVPILISCSASFSLCLSLSPLSHSTCARVYVCVQIFGFVSYYFNKHFLFICLFCFHPICFCGVFFEFYWSKRKIH